jgi:hypothetical protein
MTSAICFKCGGEKPGPFGLCAVCRAKPATEADLAVSMVLCTNTCTSAQLAALASVLRAGRQPTIPEEQLQQAREALKDAQLRSMLGLGGVGAAQAASSRSAPMPRPAQTLAAPSLPSQTCVRSDAPEATALHRNPFFLLNVTTRDNRRRIVEMAEEKSLTLDSDLCSKARADLTNPRNRLGVEVAWMPGVSPSRAATLLGGLKAHLAAIRGLENTPVLAHANLMAAGFELLDPGTDTKEWVNWILAMAVAVEEIEAEAVMRAINEDRTVAGFPQITSIEAVENELSARRRYYKDNVRDALNRLPPMKLVEAINEVVKEATEDGACHAPTLVDDIVGAYELETHRYLQQEAENVEKLIENAKASAQKGEKVVNTLLDRLDEVVRKWDRVAQPIQLSMKSRGLDHEMSHDLAYKIRSLGLELHNEHGMLEGAQRITNLLQEVFAELPSVVERLDEDSAAIEELFEKREEAKREVAEWERSITFRSELGLMFKDTLAISPRGVQWKDQVFALDSITRLRWGATGHSINGFPTGYTLCFGNSQHMATVKTNKKQVYEEFQSRLWKAVAVPLLTAMLRGLRDGKKYQFSDLVVDDLGAEITKHKIFGADERVYGTWSQLHFWNSNGLFVVGLKEDKKAYSTMSYLETDNAHLLETAIRANFKNGDPGLSSILV